jgi:hypothetical protein
VQIRFVIKSEMKQRLFREAKRRHMAAADLQREYIGDGLDRIFVKNEAQRAASQQARKTGSNLQKRRPR